MTQRAGVVLCGSCGVYATNAGICAGTRTALWKMYSYKDFETGKTKRTRGKFVGWTEPTGPLMVPYARFRNPRSEIAVPIYCLTMETRERLPEPATETTT